MEYPLRFTSDSSPRVAWLGPDATSSVPPLVLLHGFCEDNRIWANWLPKAWESHALMVDLPGFGGSEPPRVSELGHYADAVIRVLDATNTQKAIIIGHSLGGYVGLELAGRYPDRLVGLGLFHSHPFADSDERKNARTRSIELLRQGKRDLYVAQLMAGLFTEAFKTQYPEVLDMVTRAGQAQSPEGIICALEAMRDRPDYRDVLTGIEVSMLYLLGHEDPLIPVADTLATAILPRQSTVRVLPKVAHMGMLEDPMASRKSVAEFLREWWPEAMTHFNDAKI
jgi:pimeloyl-ACP methyl ester carboxylesterase